KSVTATAVVALAERGVLDLDRSADAYLGSDAPAVHAGERGAVTLRRLLQMTAAVPHGNLSFTSAEAARALTSAALVRDRLFVAFPAGETYLYSNFSYAVLERVLERASGFSYPDLLHREVFAPLGMENSFVAGWTASGHLPAARYRADGSPIAPAFPLPRSSLAVHASARDLLRYARLSLDALEPGQRRPVSPAGVAAMQRERAALPHALMALGWGSVELGDGWRWVLSNGRAGGAQATVSILPHARLAVVCLTNVTGNTMDAMAVEITERLVPGMAAKVERAMTEYEAAVNRPYAPSPELAGTWDGRCAAPASPRRSASPSSPTATSTSPSRASSRRCSPTCAGRRGCCRDPSSARSASPTPRAPAPHRAGAAPGRRHPHRLRHRLLHDRPRPLRAAGLRQPSPHGRRRRADPLSRAARYCAPMWYEISFHSPFSRTSSKDAGISVPLSRATVPLNCAPEVSTERLLKVVSVI
ncbi:MAG TPA: serine hydrolase domain-containing protein, partial [Thermoanaerobaculia bacterium]